MPLVESRLLDLAAESRKRGKQWGRLNTAGFCPAQTHRLFSPRHHRREMDFGGRFTGKFLARKRIFYFRTTLSPLNTIMQTAIQSRDFVCCTETASTAILAGGPGPRTLVGGMETKGKRC